MAVKRRSDDGERQQAKQAKQAEEAGISLKCNEATEAFAEQCYCVVPGEKRFGLLATFLKKNFSKKIICIFSSHRSLAFHKEALNCLGISSFSISERQTENNRESSLQQFEKAAKGVLLSTNAVSEGFRSLGADWTVQFEPPADGETFLKRISGERGRGLLFLLPGELEFLAFLEGAKVPLKECHFRDIKIGNAHTQLQKLVAKEYRIYTLAHAAYRSYVQGYATHPMKTAFNVKKLDIHAAALSFGIKCPPKIL